MDNMYVYIIGKFTGGVRHYSVKKIRTKLKLAHIFKSPTQEKAVHILNTIFIVYTNKKKRLNIFKFCFV